MRVRFRAVAQEITQVPYFKPTLLVVRAQICLVCGGGVVEERGSCAAGGCASAEIHDANNNSVAHTPPLPSPNPSHQVPNFLPQPNTKIRTNTS